MEKSPRQLVIQYEYSKPEELKDILQNDIATYDHRKIVALTTVVIGKNIITTVVWE
jgi:hypothetical protein